VTNKHAGRAATPRRPHAARPLNTLYMTVSLSVCVSVCVRHVRTFCQNELTYLRNFFTVV